MMDWAFGLALAGCLILLAIADIRSMVLPDALNALLAILGLMAALYGDAPTFLESLLGATLGGSLLWLVRAVHARSRGIEGLGLGDVKLATAGGVWIGTVGIPLMLLAATASALAYVAIERLRGRTLTAQTAIPFGPFLCLGIASAWMAQRLLPL